jgi:hypothetical protein
VVAERMGLVPSTSTEGLTPHHAQAPTEARRAPGRTRQDVRLLVEQRADMPADHLLWSAETGHAGGFVLIPPGGPADSGRAAAVETARALRQVVPGRWAPRREPDSGATSRQPIVGGVTRCVARGEPVVVPQGQELSATRISDETHDDHHRVRKPGGVAVIRPETLVCNRFTHDTATGIVRWDGGIGDDNGYEGLLAHRTATEPSRCQSVHNDPTPWERTVTNDTYADPEDKSRCLRRGRHRQRLRRTE